ncbi:MAG TPA: hypothetical protein DCM40_13160 [Maribacter sp.]|nr:hypothetical protein [Maribacter sp.]
MKKTKSKIDKGFRVYSVSLEDMMDIWIESFHTTECVLVIWDVKNHYDVLEECGVLLNKTVTYNGKAATIVFESILSAFDMQDKITMSGSTAYMQIYDKGKLVTDNT